MRILVSDTSALVDLERDSLLEATFRMPFEFTVPDLLYDRELKNHGGDGSLRSFVLDRRRMSLDHGPPLRFRVPGAMRKISPHGFNLVLHVASALKVLTYLRREPGEVAAGH